MMIKEVGKDIYLSEIPLPNNPLRALNSYIILEGRTALIIDTGFNHPASKSRFFQNLKTLGVDLGKSRALITHLHADHSGLAYDLYRQGCEILMSEGEGKGTLNLMKDETWEQMKEQMKSFGLNVDMRFFDQHPGKKYAPGGEFPFTVVGEGDFLRSGAYRLRVVSVPGHTPDMVNLYDEDHQIYFSGDHVLETITPNIGYWGSEHPGILGKYLDSLDKVLPLQIKMMYPSHRSVIRNHKERILQLKAHHQERLEEVKSVILRGSEEMTIEEIAAKMTWRIPFDQWQTFPPAQKAFALGEAMSHTEYLIENNEIPKWTDIRDVLKYRECE